MTKSGLHGRQIILSILIAATGMCAEFASGQETGDEQTAAPPVITSEIRPGELAEQSGSTEEDQPPERISEVLDTAAIQEDQSPELSSDGADFAADQEGGEAESISEIVDAAKEAEEQPPESIPDVSATAASQEEQPPESISDISGTAADQESQPPESDADKLDTDVEKHSVQSVEADLVHSDQIKPAIFAFDPLESRFTPYYKFKHNISNTFSLKFTTDYSILYQRASSTLSGEESAASDVFRILGTWLSIGDRAANHGTLVWKTEVRNRRGGRFTPREMGFDSGSALSTANYKEDDWGFTDLYWRQRLKGGQYSFIVGQMDPGDWADQYSLLNAWTSFLNDAFYNNPSQAIPGRGFGIVGQAFITDNLYTMVGVHDANGQGSDINFSTFFDEQEWFSWIEVGFRKDRHITSDQIGHLNYWHQDAREQAGTSESWGLAYTHSKTVKNGAVWFIRVGYSEGDAAQLRRFAGVGVSKKLFGRDVIGVATSWGSPPDKTARNQMTSELFYRLQVTQNLVLTPDVQIFYKPSFNLNKDWITVIGLRFRLVF